VTPRLELIDTAQIAPRPRRNLSFLQLKHLDDVPELAGIDPGLVFDMRVVGSVLPFTANSYVIDELIDWDAAPDDPLFRLVFPRREMLAPGDYDQVAAAYRRRATPAELRALATEIHTRLNPHPAGQMALNMPRVGDALVEGVQHKYQETLLYFPSEGQTCHSYCTFCFRWAQFVKEPSLRIAATELDPVTEYLRGHPAITDVLVTGGDPFVMKSRRIAAIVDALCRPGLEHVQTVRFGTKALSYWPYRFVADDDADELLDVFRRLRRHGKHVSIMAHFNHWREMQPDIVAEALRRIQSTGAVVRSQSPILRGINDDPDVWTRMWREQVRLGIVPYYMFVARDTGAQSCFDVPLVRAHAIYAQAIQRVSGLARTARGPSMSTSPGKIEVTGIAEIAGEKVIALRFLQARDPAWCHRPFFAAYDEEATWLDELRPAFGEREFFFEAEFRERFGG
jgi:KamA family protein